MRKDVGPAYWTSAVNRYSDKYHRNEGKYMTPSPKTSLRPQGLATVTRKQPGLDHIHTDTHAVELKSSVGEHSHISQNYRQQIWWRYIFIKVQ